VCVLAIFRRDIIRIPSYNISKFYIYISPRIYKRRFSILCFSRVGFGIFVNALISLTNVIRVEVYGVTHIYRIKEKYSVSQEKNRTSFLFFPNVLRNRVVFFWIHFYIFVVGLLPSSEFRFLFWFV